MATYKIYDSSARLVSTVVEVLAPVALTEVSTTSGSNLVTVASSANCYPGMPVAIPNIPLGAFVHSIKDATTLELWRAVWDTTTGSVSISAANANATASASSMLGRALGYCPFCIVPNFYLQGTWRNSLQPSTLDFKGAGAPASIIASEEITSFTLNTSTATPTYGAKGDEYAATPLKRHNGEPWGVRYFVSTGGLISSIPADPKYTVALSAI